MALVSTGSDRSFVVASMCTKFASLHIEITSVSPGNTTPENRARYEATDAEVSFQSVVHDRLADDPERAEAVENRAIEATERGESRIGMQGVPIAAEAIEKRLLGDRPCFDNQIGSPIRSGLTAFGIGSKPGWPDSPREAPLPASKDRCSVGEERSSRIRRNRLDHDQGCLALVKHAGDAC